MLVGVVRLMFLWVWWLLRIGCLCMLKVFVRWMFLIGMWEGMVMVWFILFIVCIGVVVVWEGISVWVCGLFSDC